MRKVKVQRASGYPVNLEDIEKYQQEYREIYDKVCKKLGIDDKTMPTEEQAERCERLITRATKMMARKYPNIREWDFIASKKEWKEKIKTHGPIALALDLEGKDLVYVIMDRPF